MSEPFPLVDVQPVDGDIVVFVASSNTSGATFRQAPLHDRPTRILGDSFESLSRTLSIPYSYLVGVGEHDTRLVPPGRAVAALPTHREGECSELSPSYPNDSGN